ncbi:MAG: DMT family transporter [Pseudomonadota bacterium]
MTQDRPFLGILLMLAFCALIPFSDALGKILGATLPIALIVFVRVATQFALLTPLAKARGEQLLPPARFRALIVLRTLLYITGIGLMFTALRFLPLADAVAIAFVMPFIMLLLGHWFLGEEVGPRRIIACAVGFAGTLMVIQPSFAEIGPLALLPLGVAVTFAIFMLLTRQIAKEIEPVALQAITGAVAALILAPLLALGSYLGWADIRFGAVSSYEAWLLAGMAVIGSVAHLLMTWSLRLAPSATLAPMQYLEIPFATLLGYLIFRDLPNGLAALGILVTISAGLYIIARERAAPQAMPQSAASPTLHGDRSRS